VQLEAQAQLLVLNLSLVLVGEGRARRRVAQLEQFVLLDVEKGTDPAAGTLVHFFVLG